MSARKNFLLVVVDHDRGIFNVVGPINDDNPINKSVVECKKGGREVNCFTVPEGHSKESTATQYSQQMGYKYVEDSVLDL